MTDVVPEEGITREQLDILNYIEQMFYSHGQIPTAEKIAEVLKIAVIRVHRVLSSSRFQRFMIEKGFIVDAPEGLLSDTQLLIANMIMNPMDRRSDREKCKEAGCSVAQLNAWRHDPTFLKYLHDRAERDFGDVKDEAHLSLIRNIRAGNMKATQLWYEMNGRYQRTMRHEVDIGRILGAVAESVQARVKDPAIIDLINDDIVQILQGKQPEYSTVQHIPEFEVPALPVAGRVIDVEPVTQDLPFDLDSPPVGDDEIVVDFGDVNVDG
jgi:Helix-turn-helix of insertion element transposase